MQHFDEAFSSTWLAMDCCIDQSSRYAYSPGRKALLDKLPVGELAIESVAVFKIMQVDIL